MSGELVVSFNFLGMPDVSHGRCSARDGAVDNVARIEKCISEVNIEKGPCLCWDSETGICALDAS